jgi:hypothetical protein
VIAYFRIPVLAGALLDSICPINLDRLFIPVKKTADGILIEPHIPSGESESEEKEKANLMLKKANETLESVSEAIRKEREKTLSQDEVSKKFFDWNNSFFQWTWVATPEKDAEIMKQIVELKSRFMDETEEYNFLFVSMLIDYVVSQAHGEIQWMLIPGFSNMLESVLFSAAKRGVGDYSHLIEHCLADVSRVSRIFSVVINMVIKSTYANNPFEVNIMCNVLDMIFMKGCRPEGFLNSKVPQEVDFEVLFNAIDLVLESEQFQIISKIVWFLYRNINRFDRIMRSKIINNLLLKKYFGKLFLHWCTEVRQIFIYFVLFRIQRAGVVSDRNPVPMIADSMSPSTHKGLLSKFLSREENKSALFEQKRKITHSDAPTIPFGPEPVSEGCLIVSSNISDDDIKEDEYVLFDML